MNGHNNIKSQPTVVLTNGVVVPFSLFLACEELKSRSISFAVVRHIVVVFGDIDWNGWGWDKLVHWLGDIDQLWPNGTTHPSLSFYNSYPLTIATVDIQLFVESKWHTRARDGERLAWVAYERKGLMSKVINIHLWVGYSIINHSTRVRLPSAHTRHHCKSLPITNMCLNCDCTIWCLLNNNGQQQSRI